jgi:hypothetical protein
MTISATNAENVPKAVSIPNSAALFMYASVITANPAVRIRLVKRRADPVVCNV